MSCVTASLLFHYSWGKQHRWRKQYLAFEYQGNMKDITNNMYMQKYKDALNQVYIVHTKQTMALTSATTTGKKKIVRNDNLLYVAGEDLKSGMQHCGIL